MVIEYRFGQYCKIVFDKTTNKYNIQWYNTNTGSWETVSEIDCANKQITVHPSVAIAYNFLDGIKLYFGTDNDYSIRYDATTDNFIIRDEVNAKEVVISRGGNITVSGNVSIGGTCSFKNVDKRGVATITPATGGAWSTPATVVAPDTGFNSVKPIAGQIKVVSIGTETVSIAVLTVYDNNTTLTTQLLTGITTTGTYDLDLINTYRDGNYIKEILIKASSNATTTGATIQAIVTAIQF